MFVAVVGLAVGGAPASARVPADMDRRSVGDAVLAAAPAPSELVDSATPSTSPDLTDVGDPGPASPNAADDPVTAAAASATLPPTEAPAAACTGTQDRPQLEPEALGTLNVRSDDPAVPTAARLGYDGEGVKIGVISTAMDPSMPDFRRPDGSSVVIDYRSYTSGGPDDAGSAAEGFGDVSSIAAQGTVAHDLATVVNPAAVTLPNGHCWIRIVGVAPAAEIFYANVNDAGQLSPAAIVRAIQDAVAAGVDVLSLSFGSSEIPDVSARNAIHRAVVTAVDAGVTVVAGSGDAGANSTIIAPAAEPRVISVGATVTGRLDAQVGGLGITRFGDGSWPDGTAASLSSSGTTDEGGTIDVVAPGDAGWSACSADPRFTDCGSVGNPSVGADLFRFAGTSQSTPFVAGIAALIIQAYRDHHGGRTPTPGVVERILTGTARDLVLPSDTQGSGLVDAHAAVLAARTLDNPGANDDLDEMAARSLVADTPQVVLDGTGDQALEVVVTNTGSRVMGLGSLDVTRAETAGRQTFDVQPDPAAPVFVDGLSNAPATAVRREFLVPPDVAGLNVQLSGVAVPRGNGFTATMVLLDPWGSPAASGSGANGLQIQVPTPSLGRWTAVVIMRADQPFQGELAVERMTQRSIAGAWADSSLLDPGASTTIHAVVPMPTQPGDAAATLRVAGQLSLPVIQRVPVDLSGGAATVSTVVRPAPGRAGNPAQKAVWEFDVPAGSPSLDVMAVLGRPAGAGMSGVLIGPDGLTRSITNNRSGTRIGRSTSQSIADPEPGRWRFVLALWGTVWSPPATRADAQVSIVLNGRKSSAVGLPNGDTMTVGGSRTVNLTVANPGPTALSVTVDPRTDARTEISVPLQGAASVALPVTAVTRPDLPSLVVPPFSTRLSVAAESTVPVVLGVEAPFGDLSVFSDLGTPGGPASTIQQPVVLVEDAGWTPGPWSVSLATPGPVLGPAPRGRAEISARVDTAAYDPTVTDVTGQSFVTATGPSADAPATVVAARESAVLTAVLATRGAPGDRVSGFLAVTAPVSAAEARPTEDFDVRSGDVLAVFPYSYTVVAADATTTASPTTDPSTTPDASTTPEPSTTPDASTTPEPSTTPDASTTPELSTTPDASTTTSPTPMSTSPSASDGGTMVSSTRALSTTAIGPQPFRPAFVTTAAPAAVPLGPSTPWPGQYAVAAPGALPQTGVDLLPWLVSATTALLIGLGLVVGARRMRRSGSH